MNLCLPELERPITLRQLNAWTAKSKEFSEFPARYIPALCWATRCDLPAHVMPQALGMSCANAADQAAMELGRLELNQASIIAAKRQIKKSYGGVL